MESVQKQLEELGLTPNEVKIYLASLEIGAATAQQLAAKAVVVRPTAYVAIGGLVKRGLMSSHTRGKKQYFQGEKPGQLLRLVAEEKKKLAEQEIKLKAIVPGLESLLTVSGQKPEVKYYEGVEGLRSMHEILYASKAASLDVIGNPQDFIKHIPETIRVMHAVKIRELGIKGREIFVSSHNFFQNFLTDKKKWKFKNLKTNLCDINGELAIFGDFVTILVYGSQIHGFVIKSPATARLFKVIFEAAWQTT